MDVGEFIAFCNLRHIKWTQTTQITLIPHWSSECICLYRFWFVHFFIFGDNAFFSFFLIFAVQFYKLRSALSNGQHNNILDCPACTHSRTYMPHIRFRSYLSFFGLCSSFFFFTSILIFRSFHFACPQLFRPIKNVNTQFFYLDVEKQPHGNDYISPCLC